MAVFYNREKAKVGTTSGTIIHWSYELTSNDPDNATTKDLLPAGYLRCDGTIYSAEIFPELATILGVGTQSRYKKPNVNLLENQFQLPDYGSKKLRASSGANLGLEVDLRLQDDNDQEITKSGVGLEVQSNIGETYEILYQGNFFLPSQIVPITGEPGFTRNTGNYTETIEVLPNAFLPHAHFHDGNRTRVRSALNNEFSAIGRNFYSRKSTLCVVPWYYNTRQDLCAVAATTFRLSGVGIPDGTSNESFLGGFGQCKRYVYGGCLQGCDYYIPPASYCLTPDLADTSVFNSETMSSYVQGLITNSGSDTTPDGRCMYPMWSGQSIGCDSTEGRANQETSTCGNVTYTGTIFTKCEPSGLFGGAVCAGMPQAAKQGRYGIPPNYKFTNVPFDGNKDGDRPGISAISNTTTEVQAFGNDGSHRHFVNFTAQPHTYQLETVPTFIPASNLSSTLKIQVNEQNKADQFVQPYLVQEFLIKY
tara:strand:+ start:568 stop:2001 length:1434 start_codon:yes stop_codon:yes gene_type:complete